MASIIPNLIISDFDMTFFNFKEVDNKIINKIFEGHKFVLQLDYLLWKINSLGIIGNSMAGLKLRLFIYSMLTFFTIHIKYNYIFEEYEKMYKNLALRKYKRKTWLINQINDRGYRFRILTNNKFASELGISDIIYTKSKRDFLKEYPPEYLIGDNFWDDYRNTPKGTKYVNVGDGIISRLSLKNVSCIKNMYEIFEVLS